MRRPCQLFALLLALLVAAPPAGGQVIGNIPAGVELEYRIWHEQAEFMNLDTVTIDDGTAKNSVEVKKGRFKLSLVERDEPYLLEFEVDASVFQ